MKKKEFQNLRQEKTNELSKKLGELRKEIVKIKLNMAMKKEKSTSSIEGKKKDIARILTIINERNTKNESNS